MVRAEGRELPGAPSDGRTPRAWLSEGPFGEEGTGGMALSEPRLEWRRA